MFAFERFNKRIKSLCRNRYFALESLANSCSMDIATRFEIFKRNMIDAHVVEECVLKGKSTYYTYVVKFAFDVIDSFRVIQCIGYRRTT